jgi:inorganic pyrophosphatase
MHQMNFPKPFFRWRPHPWHGLGTGPDAPRIIHAFIEITPFDLIKYEVDKETGYLRADRPQRTSSLPPSLYGFIPRTYCHDRVRALSPIAKKGDGDPLDVCVLSERPINHPEVILNARVIGGIQMIDHGEADDKIVAVLENDPVWSGIKDISEVHEIFIQRLRHYFATYKTMPDEPSRVSIESVYGCEHALKVVQAAIDDYDEVFGK